MSVRDLASHMPAPLSGRLLSEGDALNEIRLRAGRPAQFVYGGGDEFFGEPISAQQLRRIAVSMMEHSYYARESELSRGYFTMKNGCRVGVCGSFAEKQPGMFALRAIGSLSVRIARAVPGCADDIVARMVSGGLRSALILSRPGLGKTTMLRDAARQLSDNGHVVAIADERHEIAACQDGVPTMDVGLRTDVADGILKAQAMEYLIRAMSPQVVVTDEIGNEDDVSAIREAARRGVSIIASAHASGFEDFEASRMGVLVREGLFPLAFMIDGAPGRIVGIRRYDRGGNVCS